jgi:hypothetical protein
LGSKAFKPISRRNKK